MDFADDLALISSKFKHIQSTRVKEKAERVELKQKQERQDNEDEWGRDMKVKIEEDEVGGKGRGS